MKNFYFPHELELFDQPRAHFSGGNDLSAQPMIKHDTMRLLTKADAAGYCRMSIPTFDRVCPVRPVELEPGNPRLLRYDVRDLDTWIDDMKTSTNGAPPSIDISADEFLARLDK